MKGKGKGKMEKKWEKVEGVGKRRSLRKSKGGERETESQATK